MPEPRPLYELWDKQAEGAELLGLGDKPARVNELLYGGMAGGGKSAFVRAVAASVAYKWPGSIFPIFRRTYPELEENMIRKALQEYPEDDAKWSAERKEFQWSNGSITEFRHCDREDDVMRYRSAEWQGLGIDEATDFSPFMISFLRSRVRRPEDPERLKKIKGADRWVPTICYASNPGGIGHRYLKEGFVDHEGKPPWEAPKEDGGLRRYFLRARLADNLSLNETDYMRLLEGIQDPVVRRAMAEGDWSIFAGQFFSTYRYDTHVCEPFEIPPDWIKWTGQDWGIAKWAACTWWARVPPLYPIKMKSGITVRSERPRTILYREWMQKGLSTEEQAMSLVVLSNYDELIARYADPHCWDQSPRGGSIASDFIDLGWYIQKANNDRKAGWGRVQGMLQGHDMMPPELLIMDHCINFKKAIEEAPRDKMDWEDVDCFVAGTLISTPHGDVPVETLQLGDLVDTPVGPREVVKDGISGVGQVMTVRLSNGESLTGTLDHKVFVEGHGLIPLMELSVGDILIEKSEAERRWRIRSRSTEMLGEWFSTFQRATTSIISTATQATTTPPTLSFLAPSSMEGSTYAAGWPTLSRRLLSIVGTTAPRGRNNFDETLKKCMQIRLGSGRRASIVEVLLRHGREEKKGLLGLGKKLNSARADVPTWLGWLEDLLANAPFVGRNFTPSAESREPVRVSALGLPESGRQVFNLTVDDAHLYFANGVLVTNTNYEFDDILDSARYGLQGGVRTFKAQRRQRATYRVNTVKHQSDDNGLIVDLFGARRAVR